MNTAEKLLQDSIIVDTGKEPDAAVIWMHGLGSDGHDFESLVPELHLSPELKIHFVFPTAPLISVQVNNGFPTRAWFDMTTMDISQAPDFKGIHAMTRTISDMVDLEIQAGFAPSRILLAGFSQGAVLSLEVALRSKKPLGGVLVLSGCCTSLEEPGAPRLENCSTPIFWGHGNLDDVIPFPVAEKHRQALKMKGYSLDSHDYPGMMHAVCMPEVQDISAFLTRILFNSRMHS